MATGPKAVTGQELEDSNKKRLRSPAYPFINLETAIKRAKTFYDKEGRGASPLTVAAKHWGFEPKSSGSTQTAAALMSFGLMVDEDTGDKRKVKLTPNALKVLLDNRSNSSEKEALIKQIALTPKIHQKVWEKWGTAENVSDENIQHILVFDWEPPFNENTVGGFIREYRDTIAFAKLSESDTVPMEDGKSEDKGGPLYVPKVGDYVQWESQGVLQFKEPVKVLSVSTDRTYAFVAETQAGLPVGELIRATVPLKEVTQSQHTPLLPKTTMKEDVYSIDEGRVIVQWPANLSAESFKVVKEYLKILELKLEASVTKNAQQGKSE